MSKTFTMDQLRVAAAEAYTAVYAVKLRKANERIAELCAMLDEVVEYCDQRADADHDGDRFVANSEMRLMMEIEEVLSK